MRIESVHVVGAGGTGSWLLVPLARFLAAERYEGALHIWDGDKFENDNAARQQFSAAQVNSNKAAAQCASLLLLHPNLNVRAHAAYVGEQNVDALMTEGGAILVCVDNHPARVLLARGLCALNNAYLITCGNELTDGNVHITIRQDGYDLLPTLLDRHPELAESRQGARGAGCADQIAQGVTQLLPTNFLAAAYALAAFVNVWQLPAEALDVVETYFDVRQLAAGAVKGGTHDHHDAGGVEAGVRRRAEPKVRTAQGAVRGLEPNSARAGLSES